MNTMRSRCRSTEVSPRNKAVRVLEQSRMTYVRRFGGELEKLARSELDFAKRLLEEVVPFKISFDGRLWEELAAKSPIRVEFVGSSKGTGAGVGSDAGADAGGGMDSVEPAVDALEQTVERPIA